MARYTNISHTIDTVGGTDTATNIVESFFAFRIPDEAVLFAALRVFFLALLAVPEGIANTSSISGRLEAVSTSIGEAFWA